MGLDSPTLDAYMASLPPALDLEKTYVDTATITKRIRAELAAAVTAGVFPAGTRFAVRKDHHKSIDVDIVAWDGAVLCDAYIDHIMDATTRDKSFESEATRVLGRHGWRYGDKRCTVALNQAMVDADRLANRHNYDNSDSMTDYFDVGYYLDVDANTVIGLAEQAIRAESDPALAELTARASLAAKRLGSAVVKSYCGKRGLDACGKWALERLIDLDERAKGRPVSYDKRRRAWVIDTNAPVPIAADDTQTEIAANVTAHDVSDCDATHPKADSAPQYFRCFLNGRNLGDTPFVVRDGIGFKQAVACDGSYGLIEAVGDAATRQIEPMILASIATGKRGGTVRANTATKVQWMVVS